MPEYVSQDENVAFELLMSHKTRICPHCHRDFGCAGYGSGALAEGLFCSLQCFASYWYVPGGRSSAG